MNKYFARRLRVSLTDAEARLWAHLRRHQIDDHRFRRQAPIGPYIVDFVCFAQGLVIEIDGGQYGRRRDQDRARSKWLESQGFRVLRFWNNEVLENIDGVFHTIRNELRREFDPNRP